MLYLAIDQHRKQLTMNLRDESGNVLVRRQVSTQWDKVREFFADLQERSSSSGGFVAILEVCGFNDWLLKMLCDYGCLDIVLVQPEKRSRKKTDRRDAQQLGDLLWVNRARLASGQRVHGLRRVIPPSASDAEARRLTGLRCRLVKLRTRTLNRIQHILLRHNLQQACPTKGLQTKRARAWLKKLPLPALDRLEMDHLLQQWKLVEGRLPQVDERIVQRQQDHADAVLIASLPGAAAFSSLALACRVSGIDRFPTRDSLANYWGLTPSSRNSGDQNQRLGSITKQGSALARFVLGQMTLHMLRQDRTTRAWYQRIKRRRGSKIARVATMRRLTMLIWHMLKTRIAFCPDPKVRQGAKAFQAQLNASDGCAVLS